MRRIIENLIDSIENRIYKRALKLVSNQNYAPVYKDKTNLDGVIIGCIESKIVK